MSSHPNAGSEELSPVKRALLQIRELKERLADAEAAANEPIAIVGAGLRLPGGVNDLASLWELLHSGRDAITTIPRERWDIDALFDEDADAPGKMFTRHGGFIEGVDAFDAEFFGISPREAESMDPQQRLLLETAWHAFEDAGIAPSALHGSRAGVFLGVCNNDYGRMLFAHPQRIDPYFSPGNAGSVVSGRLSYFLGTHGPSITVDTACSSSLVAIHLAMQSLRAGECELALAGGINLILSPEMNINFSKGRMMARDGRCKTFDDRADGYVRGEGCGVVVLRRLRDCTAADRVLAVLRGSAINQDGRSGGLTAPNGPAQEAVIRAALASASLQPAQIAYVEAHGTGTSLGDPIEVQALGAALSPGRDAAQPLAIGSIKTNVGHLEAAAGVAGLLKVVLALQHREIPPHLHLQTLNSHIDWAAWPIVVPTVATPWQSIGGRRLAGVSSFGFSGTNAHVIVEEAPQASERALPETDRLQHVLALSARDARALQAQAAAFAERLHETRDTLADICFTSNTGRTHFSHRLTLRGETREAMQKALLAFTRGAPAAGLVHDVSTAPPRIAFLFTGGGAQSVGMALGLYERSAVFRAALDAAAAILDPLIGRSLIDVLRAPGEADAPIHQTRFGQPALVAVEIALAALWRSWGIVPSAVLGHSLGEYAAAHVAGVLSLEDALRIVVERTRQVDTLKAAGAMTTVFASAEEVQAVLDADGQHASIAAYNGPEQVVISGPQAVVERIGALFETRGVRVSRLRVAYASHSALMDPVLASFEQALAGVRFAEPRITFVSNLSGAPAGLSLIGRAAYWRDHLRQPVRFAQSVQALHELGCTHFVEIGPHPVLVGMGAACVPPGTGSWLPSLRREEDDWSVMLDTLQTLYTAGASVDWAGFDAGLSRRRVSLPLYPFQRKRHWAEWAGSAALQTDTAHAWHSVAAALERQADRGPIGVDLGNYAAKWACLERLTVAHAASALRAVGLFGEPGSRATISQVRERLGAAETYRHLLQRWLKRLVDAGQLRADGDNFVADTPLAEPALAACWQEADTLLADNRPLLDYVRHCGTLLQTVLNGQQSALETLFPGGSFELADGLYRRSATMRYINDLAASAVEAFVAARPTGPIRVLEIGAGTGGTSAALLPCLPAGRTRYRYTDVSAFFFDRAREGFATFPFIDFAEFDLDKTIESQGLSAGGFDLVVAANAVHASRDLRAALQRLRALVAPGGLLLLVETTAHLAWFDMTTGLIEGWQHFADDLRTDNPLLPAATWTQALHDAGFDAAGAWPIAGSAAEALGQHVVIARVAGDAPGDTALAASDAVAPARGVSAAAASAETARALRQQVLDALPDERLELLRDFVRDHVVRVLKLDADEPPGRNDRLMDLGFDSLMAVQLRNQLGLGLGLDKPLPATLMFDQPTIDALATYLLERVAPPETEVAVVSKAVAKRAPETLGAAAVAAMSDADIEALLLSRLERK
ncbi:MAG: beta-ketoacyl synthase N-terminal-like domain-containing protein [Burkholderiales bacterium]